MGNMTWDQWVRARRTRVASERERYRRGDISHAEYFLWLAALAGIHESMVPFTDLELYLSRDHEHFNDLSLLKWDSRHNRCAMIAGTAGLSGWAVSDTVCCLKALAGRRLALVKPVYDLATM